MKTSEKGRELIKQFEGKRNTVYLDTAGLPTVGYGHMDQMMQVGQHYSDEQINALFDKDLGKVEACLNEEIKAPVTQNQFDALADLTFNIGVYAFTNSTLLKMLNRQEYYNIPNQIRRWNHVKGIVVEGLTHRREAEARLFET